MSEFAAVKTTVQQLLSHPTWDLMLVLGLFAIGFFYGISTGRYRVASTIIYTYVAYAVFSAVPISLIKQFADAEEFLLKAGVFSAIFLLLVFLMGKGRARRFASFSSWWQIFLLSFLQVGLFIHILLGFLPEDRIRQLAPLTKNFFANPDFHIWWFLVPLAVLIIVLRTGQKET